MYTVNKTESMRNVQFSEHWFEDDVSNKQAGKLKISGPILTQSSKLPTRKGREHNNNRNNRKMISSSVLPALLPTPLFPCPFFSDTF
jgi:hypothetical protein